MLEIQDGTLEEEKGGKEEDGVSGRQPLAKILPFEYTRGLSTCFTAQNT